MWSALQTTATDRLSELQHVRDASTGLLYRAAHPVRILENVDSSVKLVVMKACGVSGVSGTRTCTRAVRCRTSHLLSMPPPYSQSDSVSKGPKATTKMGDSMQEQRRYRSLEVLKPDKGHRFAVPAKKINDGNDVLFFLSSAAYSDIMTFLFQLNAAMFPRFTDSMSSISGSAQVWDFSSPAASFSPMVHNLRGLLARLSAFIDEAPPDTGPRRFGNISFRKWYGIVNSYVSALLEEFLPDEVLQFGHQGMSTVTPKDELQAYLLGSFGSAQRLDYGTGHELSFLAFLGCLWKLGGFARVEPGVEERAIVIGVVEPYVQIDKRSLQAGV